jgi:hypothetical protein
MAPEAGQFSKLKNLYFSFNKGEQQMIKITFEEISVSRMSNSSGIFIGKKNTHKKFRKESVINEVVGVLSGGENIVSQNYWVKNKEKWKDDH